MGCIEAMAPLRFVYQISAVCHAVEPPRCRQVESTLHARRLSWRGHQQAEDAHGASRSKKSQENTLCRNSRGRPPSHLMFAVAERCIVHWSRALLRPCSSASGSRRSPLRLGATYVPTVGMAITAIRHRSPVEGCAPRRRGGKGPSRKKK